MRLFLAWKLLLVAAAAAGTVRAQVTESPTTVAPGHFQLKVDAVSLKLEKRSTLPPGTRYAALAVGTTYLTTGLSSRMDLQLGAELFLRERYTVGGKFETSSGVGNLYIKPKWTFWIDPGKQALAAVVPYVKLPAGSSAVTRKKPEGGVIVPWEMFLDRGFRAGAMAQWDFVRNDDDNGYDSRWMTAFNFQHDVWRIGSLYFESTLAVDSAGLDRLAFDAGLGLTLQVTSLIRVDAAYYVGLTPAAIDRHPIVRLKWDW